MVCRWNEEKTFCVMKTRKEELLLFKRFFDEMEEVNKDYIKLRTKNENTLLVDTKREGDEQEMCVDLFEKDMFKEEMYLFLIDSRLMLCRLIILSSSKNNSNSFTAPLMLEQKIQAKLENFELMYDQYVTLKKYRKQCSHIHNNS